VGQAVAQVGPCASPLLPALTCINSYYRDKTGENPVAFWRAPTGLAESGVIMEDKDLKDLEEFLNAPEPSPMEKLIFEIRDLKRAHCEVTNTNTVSTAFAARAVQGCQVVLWIIAVLMGIGLWHW